MPVRYTGPDGPTELIPAPLVVIQKNFVRTPDGKVGHIDYLYTLTGTIVNLGISLDSPGNNGEGFSLDGVLGAQKFIRRLFSQDGGRLEIESPNGGGSNTLDTYCFLEGVTFDKNVWVDICTYTVVLRSRAIESASDVDNQLDTFSENWNITENVDSTFNISHQLSAKGALSYTGGTANDPMMMAKSWVQSRMYATSTSGVFNPINGVASGVTFDLTKLITALGNDSNNFWNTAVVESVEPRTYTYNITENFIYNPSGPAKEVWNASLNYQENNLRRATISLNGDVVGYADRASDLDLRNLNASGYYYSSVEPNLYLRALSFAPSGFSVGALPSSKQINFEHSAGAIKYNYNFVANNGSLIPGAIEENLTVNTIGANDVFASIPVPGRSGGPVIQYMFTTTSPERTVAITATLTPDITPITSGSLLAAFMTKPQTDDIISILRPSSGNYYVKQDAEEWNPIKRQYSRSVAWLMQNTSGVYGIPDAYRNPALI